MNRVKHITSGVSLALVLAVSAAAGCLFLSIFLEEVADELLQTNDPLAPTSQEELVLSEEGTPIIVHRQWRPFDKRKIFDLDHQPMQWPLDKPLIMPVSLPVEPPRRSHWLRNRGPSRRVQRAVIGDQGVENWFLVFDGNRSDQFFLQGLSRETGQTVGYFARDGFQGSRPTGETLFLMGPLRLADMLDRTMTTGTNSLVFVMDDRQLLSVDVARRSVQSLFEDPVLSLDGLGGWMDGFSSYGPSKLCAVRTSARIHVLHWDGAIRKTYLIPDELRDRPFGFFVQEEEEIAIYSAPSNEAESLRDSGAEQRTHRYDLLWATASGEVTERKQIALTENTPHRGGLSDEAGFRIPVAAVPATLWSTGMAFGLLPEAVASLQTELDFSQALEKSAGQVWWVVVLVLGLSLWLSWLTFQHQRRHGEPDGWVWAAFVFLLGLPGYLGYRMHQSWPPSEPVPAPEPTGLEVFAQ